MGSVSEIISEATKRSESIHTVDLLMFPEHIYSPKIVYSILPADPINHGHYELSCLANISHFLNLADSVSQF